jgi:hypothetical protein
MSIRANLDDYVSIACFKSVITGVEDILGEEGTAAALISAGRKRGATVAIARGIAGTSPAPESLAGLLDDAVGKDGTRLCQVVESSRTAEGDFLIKTKETVCTSGEPAGSQRTCTYTMGVVIGFIEQAYNTPLTGKHVASVLNGSPSDDFLIKKF